VALTKKNENVHPFSQKCHSLVCIDLKSKKQWKNSKTFHGSSLIFAFYNNITFSQAQTDATVLLSSCQLIISYLILQV
jgi:hypothetical protein